MENDPGKRANVTELLRRLGPPEPDKNDETSLDEDGFEQQQDQIQPNMSTETPAMPSSAGPGSRATSPSHSIYVGDGTGTEMHTVSVQQQQMSSTVSTNATAPSTTNNSATIAHQPPNLDG